MGLMIHQGINYYNVLSEYKPEQKIINICNYKIKNYNEPPKGWNKRIWGWGVFKLVALLNTASGHNRKGLHKKKTLTVVSSSLLHVQKS